MNKKSDKYRGGCYWTKPVTVQDCKPVPESIRKIWTGEVNGKVTIIGYSRAVGYRHFWIGECRCGKVFEIAASNIKRTLQCRKCKNNHIGQCARKHGQSKTYLYRRWLAFRKQGRLDESIAELEDFVKGFGQHPEGKPYLVPVHYENRPYTAGDLEWREHRNTSNPKNSPTVELPGKRMVSMRWIAKEIGRTKSRVGQIIGAAKANGVYSPYWVSDMIERYQTRNRGEK